MGTERSVADDGADRQEDEVGVAHLNRGLGLAAAGLEVNAFDPSFMAVGIHLEVDVRVCWMYSATSAGLMPSAGNICIGRTTPRWIRWMLVDSSGSMKRSMWSFQRQARRPRPSSSMPSFLAALPSKVSTRALYCAASTATHACRGWSPSARAGPSLLQKCQHHRVGGSGPRARRAAGWPPGRPATAPRQPGCGAGGRRRRGRTCPRHNRHSGSGLATRGNPREAAGCLQGPGMLTSKHCLATLLDPLGGRTIISATGDTWRFVFCAA